MPTYQYKCKKCGEKFDIFQGINDPLLKTCPHCNKDSLKRLIGTGAGIIFKGNGFYQTDYRSESYIKAQSKESESNKPKPEKSEKKESAPSSKTPVSA